MNPKHRLATLGLLLALAACGGDGGSPAAQPAPTPVPAPPPPPPPPTGRAPDPTAQGVVVGQATQADIGPAGGQLASPDGSLTVQVPAGAFDRVRTVAIAPISNQAHGGQGSAWRITPEGLDTPVPMTIEWRYTAAQARGLARLAVATQGADGVWRIDPARQQHDAHQRVLRVQTTHFSDWSFVAGVQLRPGSAEVATGGTLQLTVRDCGTVPDRTLPGQQALYACRDDGASSIAAEGWAVNGMPGGNASVGQLAEGGDVLVARRTYTAPATAPSQNPVAVSVRYVDPFSNSRDTLVANVTVIDANAGCAAWAGVQTLDAELAYQYQWSGSDATVTQRFNQRADTRGVLQRSPQTPFGQAWFEGQLTSGTVQADNETAYRGVPDRITVNANGAPIADPGLPALVRVFVRLDTCTVTLSASGVTRGEHLSHGAQGSAVMDDTIVGGDVSVVEQALAGRRELVADTTLPAYTQVEGSAWFRPHGTHHDFEGQIGAAQVRYAFRPR